jgi:class 3 adenylate cyclase
MGGGRSSEHYIGFTNLSSRISPHELVALLNDLFTIFDDIMDNHNLEKVRTVGYEKTIYTILQILFNI